ncbi:hypothetical protein [Brevibacillus borstelensis]|uniref:hypothetical protein n=1 Tax=Brevibacillus borstelensis TaxID=45462 RepID=UPI0020A37CA0|nr:hypothetical protein [Brevibacillus borstelensis]
MNFLQSMCGPHHLPPRLEVHQSWWAMRGIGDENGEWSLAKKLAKIAEAGYGGIMGRLPAPEEAGLWRSLLDHYNLQFGVEAFPEEPEEFAAFLRKAKQFGVSYVNAQVKDSFVVGEKAINRLKGIIREGKNHGIPVRTADGLHRICCERSSMRKHCLTFALPSICLITSWLARCLFPILRRKRAFRNC